MAQIIRPDRVAIYIRWSTDDQANGTTLQVQLDSCRHYVTSQGWAVRNELVFIDDGYSGATLDRPSMKRLRIHIEAGEIDCVVVHKIDRLSRNLLDTVTLVLKEWDGACAIRSVLEPIDTASDHGRVLFSILAVFAEHERSIIRERTVSGRLKRTQAGEINPARPPLGYRLVGGKRGVWEEHSIEGPIVRHIFRLAADGLSVFQIVQDLRSAGVPSRTGKAFTVRTVNHVLCNRAYIGELIYGKCEVKRIRVGVVPAPSDRSRHESAFKIRRIKRPTPLVHLHSVKAFPAIVDQELWKEAHRHLTHNRDARSSAGSRGLHSRHLLSGLLQCECGSNMVYQSPQGRYGYYVCSAKRTRKSCPLQSSISSHIADALIEHTFFATFISGQGANFSNRLRDLDIDRTSASAGLSAAQEELARLSSLMQSIRHEAREASIDRKTLAGYLKYLRKVVATAAKSVQAAQHRLEHMVTQLEQVQLVRNHQISFENWMMLPVPRRRYLMLMGLTGRIIVRRTSTNDYEFICTWSLPLC